MNCSPKIYREKNRITLNSDYMVQLKSDHFVGNHMDFPLHRMPSSRGWLITWLYFLSQCFACVTLHKHAFKLRADPSFIHNFHEQHTRNTCNAPNTKFRSRALFFWISYSQKYHLSAFSHYCIWSINSISLDAV